MALNVQAAQQQTQAARECALVLGGTARQDLEYLIQTVRGGWQGEAATRCDALLQQLLVRMDETVAALNGYAIAAAQRTETVLAAEKAAEERRAAEEKRAAEEAARRKAVQEREAHADD